MLDMLRILFQMMTCIVIDQMIDIGYSVNFVFEYETTKAMKPIFISAAARTQTHRSKIHTPVFFLHYESVTYKILKPHAIGWNHIQHGKISKSM